MKTLGPQPDPEIEMFLRGYRNALRCIETSTHDMARADWQNIAGRMREAWREWQGEDSLHEMACGVPS